INCSVLGYQNLEVSVCEQPLASGEYLSYEDKYLTGGKTKGMASLSRLIPAPISKSLTGKIQETAKKVFRITDSAGVARVDFLVEPKTEKFYVCEINTLPGSLAFYLWEKSGPPAGSPRLASHRSGFGEAGEAGLPFPKLIDRLIDLAYDRFNDREKNSFSFSSNLLENFSGASKLQK
ncbi:MAG: hypothetical protein Q8N98_02585, partial [bacterium]|nr:hypothetical protein [bacterium]